MPVISCPVEGCTWESQDLDVAFAAALNTSLQMHDKTAHAQITPAKLKLKPPTVGAGCTPDQWSSFTRQWEMYKSGMAIAPTQSSTALFHCCDDELKTDLMRDLQRDVATMDEVNLLSAIKRLAVKDESILVHRIRLGKMTQAPGTNIRTFLANLRGQAALCQYVATCKISGCNHKYDYSDEIIKDNLVRGIADPEILSDLLGDPKTDRTLDETVSFIAQKEQGKATRSAVGDCTAAISHPTKNVKSLPEGAKCWACGTTGTPGASYAQLGRRSALNAQLKGTLLLIAAGVQTVVLGATEIKCQDSASNTPDIMSLPVAEAGVTLTRLKTRVKRESPQVSYMTSCVQPTLKKGNSPLLTTNPSL